MTTEPETQPTAIDAAVLDVRDIPLGQIPAGGLLERLRPGRRDVGSDRVPVAAFNASL